MVTSEKNKYERRNTHKWRKNTCVHCGCYRMKETHPNNKMWSIWKYYDAETGEEKRKTYCKTNQLILIL